MYLAVKNVDRLPLIIKGPQPQWEISRKLSRKNVSSRHKEPKNISWQWLARKKPVSDCKDLCTPKVCPKKRFFPRYKRVFTPIEKKPCSAPKKKMTWMEYFSFLMPDPVKKPPLRTCRKLHAERRRICEHPEAYPGYCLNDNCCPPPKEWYGQAVVYQVPHPFPEPVPPGPALPCGVTIEKDPGTELRQLNLENYAYKKPFQNVSFCEAEIGVTAFPSPKKCFEEFKNIESIPICHFLSAFKEKKAPSTATFASGVPNIICKSSEGPDVPQVQKAVHTEFKKDVCGRQSFLKPTKCQEIKPGIIQPCRKFHTLRKLKEDSLYPHVRNSSGKSDSDGSKDLLESFISVKSVGLTEADKRSWNEPSSLFQPGPYNPNTYSLSVKNQLANPFARPAYNVKVSEPDAEVMEADPRSEEVPGINPELLKLAKETSAKLKPVNTVKGSEEADKLTLAKLLTRETIKRQKSSASNVKKPPFTKAVDSNVTPNKLTFCKVKPPMKTSIKNFSVSSAHRAGKKDKKICSGCPGVLAAEEEEKNPTPKSFMDCKVRVAGKCRGPTRKLEPGEPEPNNPYFKNKALSLSLCNRPRIPPCKKERGYKMPCEEDKKKYHTAAPLNGEAQAFCPLKEIVQKQGLLKYKNYSPKKINLWDSHTAESYIETNNVIDNSLPDLSQFKGIAQENRRFNARKTVRKGANKSEDDWEMVTGMNKVKHKGASKVQRIDSAAEESGQSEGLLLKNIMGQAHEQSKSSITVQVKQSIPVNLWETQASEKEEGTEENTLPFGGDTSTMSFKQEMVSKPAELPVNKKTRLNSLFGTNRNVAAPKVRAQPKIKHAAGDFLNPMDE